MLNIKTQFSSVNKKDVNARSLAPHCASELQDFYCRKVTIFSWAIVGTPR